MTNQSTALWFVLLSSFLLSSDASGLVFLEGTFPMRDECVPLRILNEREVQTTVGRVCVQFKDDAQDWLVVTYNTTTTDYVLDEVSMYYGNSAENVPTNALGKPDPSQFQIKQAVDSGKVASLEVQLDRLGTIGCPSSERWTKYLVAHALVDIPGSNATDSNDTQVEVYGHEGTLYAFTSGDSGESEHYSYWRLDLRCDSLGSTPDDQRNNPANVTTDADAPSSDETTMNVTTDPTESITEPSSMSASPSVSPSASPSVSPSSSASVSPSSSPTGFISRPPPPREEKLESNVFENESPSSAPSEAPTTAPVSNSTGVSIEGEDLVVGLSFVVLAGNSKDRVNNTTIQASFEEFARMILEEMRILSYHAEPPVLPGPPEEGAPPPPMPPGVGSGPQNKPPNPPPETGTSNRRELWVKYYNSFKVYDFLVNEDCSRVEQELAITKTSSLRQPAEQSQCQRAYARMTIRIADEDPVKVCEMIREGTLAGYQRGQLQEAHVAVNPDSGLQLKPGDFDYCVPIDEFEVPEFEEEERWVDSDPLADILVMEEEEKSEDGNKTWLWILILLLGLLLCLFCGWLGHRQQLKTAKNGKQDTNMDSSEVDQYDDEASMS